MARIRIQDENREIADVGEIPRERAHLVPEANRTGGQSTTCHPAFTAC